MSKMANPSMEVVRFKEKDIIVASGGGNPEPDNTYLHLANFNDGIAGNGTIDNYSINDFINIMIKTHDDANNVLFQYKKNDTVTLSNLLAEEETRKVYDGDYSDSPLGEGKYLWTWVKQ